MKPHSAEFQRHGPVEGLLVDAVKRTVGMGSNFAADAVERMDRSVVSGQGMKNTWQVPAIVQQDLCLWQRFQLDGLGAWPQRGHHHRQANWPYLAQALPWFLMFVLLLKTLELSWLVVGKHWQLSRSQRCHALEVIVVSERDLRKIFLQL